MLFLIHEIPSEAFKQGCTVTVCTAVSDCSACEDNSDIVLLLLLFYLQEQRKILGMGITGPEGHPLSRPEEVFFFP